ncbi:MAG: hypothetical protein ACE5E7_06270 [Anaerolineae bacterium]
MSLLNQFSAVVILVLFIGLTLGALALRHRFPNGYRYPLMAGALAAAFTAWFLFLQPRPVGAPPDKVASLLLEASGRPVLIELYSDY